MTYAIFRWIKLDILEFGIAKSDIKVLKKEKPILFYCSIFASLNNLVFVILNCITFVLFLSLLNQIKFLDLDITNLDIEKQEKFFQ